eukprot:713989-Amphidinium_carterae.1
MHAPRRGGLWRAWVRHHTLGTTGIPDLRYLATKYRQACVDKDPLLLTLKNFVEATKCSLAVSHIARSSSSFGARGRDLDRMQAKMQRYGMWLNTHKKSLADRAHALAMYTPSYTALDKAVSSARQQQVLDGVAAREKLQMRLGLISAWHKDHGQHLIDALQRRFPDIPWTLFDTVALPATQGSTIVMTASASSQATSALAAASHCQGTNVPAALEKEWAEFHEPTHASAGKPPPMSKETRCKQAGICLCQGKGLLLFKFRNKVVQVMKGVFNTGPKRDMLVAGDIVLKFLPGTACDQHAGVDVTTRSVWFHIGRMLLNPYKPTFHLLQPCPGDEFGSVGKI